MLGAMNSPDTASRLNAALEGRYRVERQLGEGWNVVSSTPGPEHPERRDVAPREDRQPFNRWRGPMRFQLWSLLLVLVLAGCAAAATASGGGNSNLITSALLREADPEGLSVYQIIQRDRPHWLRAGRGAPSFGNAAGGAVSSAFARVVLDGVPYGEIDELRRLDTNEVDSIEYMSASDATTRFGTGYVSGAILVRTR